MKHGVVYDEELHRYSIGDRTLPSVTQALNQISELDGIPKHLLERAAHFGRHVHLACHLFNIGTLDEDSVSAPLIPYLDGWKRFLSDTGAEVVVSEYRVHHPKLHYAGTLDAAVRVKAWGRVPRILDLKSSDTVPRSTGPQTAGYREAYNQHEQEKLSKIRHCVHLTGKGRYKLHTYDDPRDWNIFLSCLNLHDWRTGK